MGSNGIGEGKSYSLPNRVRVLVVEYDETLLFSLESMLNACGYEVTKCGKAEEGLNLLRRDKSKYDIVISDVYSPGLITGFDLLQIISSEFKLPVIMVSSDDRSSVIMKAIILGCCDYFVWPVAIESVKKIWQHVFRRKHRVQQLIESGLQSQHNQIIEPQQQATSLSVKEEQVEDENNRVKRERERENEVEDEQNLFNIAKKPRLVWSPELHQKFVNAVNQLGYENAVPKKILEIMQSMGFKNLSRENIASHLQKYREYVSKERTSKRSSPLIQNPMSTNNSQLTHELERECNYNPSLNNGPQNATCPNSGGLWIYGVVKKMNPSFDPLAMQTNQETVQQKICAVSVDPTQGNKAWSMNVALPQPKNVQNPWPVNQPNIVNDSNSNNSNGSTIFNEFEVDEHVINVFDDIDAFLDAPIDNTNMFMSDLPNIVHIDGITRPTSKTNPNPNQTEPIASNDSHSHDDLEQTLTPEDMQNLLNLESNI